jgi:hypothetical protein
LQLLHSNSIMEPLVTNLIALKFVTLRSQLHSIVRRI